MSVRRRLDSAQERFENWILRGQPWTKDRRLRQIRFVALFLTLMNVIGAVINFLTGRWVVSAVMVLLACLTAYVPLWYTKRR